MGKEPGSNRSHVGLRAALHACEVRDVLVVSVEGTDELLERSFAVRINVVQVDAGEKRRRLSDLEVDRPAGVELFEIKYELWAAKREASQANLR